MVLVVGQIGNSRGFLPVFEATAGHADVVRTACSVRWLSPSDGAIYEKEAVEIRYTVVGCNSSVLQLTITKGGYENLRHTLANSNKEDDPARLFHLVFAHTVADNTRDVIVFEAVVDGVILGVRPVVFVRNQNPDAIRLDRLVAFTNQLDHSRGHIEHRKSGGTGHSGQEAGRRSQFTRPCPPI